MKHELIIQGVISTPYGWDGGSAQAPLQHFSIRG